MTVFCGIDWAENHHDVAVINADGKLLAKRRIDDDAAGVHRLLDLLAEMGDHPDAPIPVAIETSRGLLVASLQATGRKVYAINPMAVSRYGTGIPWRAKSPTPATRSCWPTSWRTDLAAHQPLPADSDLAQAIAVLARAQQDAVWDRTCAHNRLRGAARVLPAIMAAFADKRDGLLRPEARAVLAAAPTPTAAATLTKTQLRALFKRAGRQRDLAAEAERIQRILRSEQLHEPALVEQALGRQALALLRQLDATCASACWTWSRSPPRPARACPMDPGGGIR